VVVVEVMHETLHPPVCAINVDRKYDLILLTSNEYIDKFNGDEVRTCL